jgi:Kef-type K+ transport system membrane component KefB
MSSAGDHPKTVSTRAIQAVSLVVLFGLLFGANRIVPENQGKLGSIAALGFLLLAGTLISELVEIIKLPHLSGYILAGVVAGPYVLNLVDHHAVGDLSVVNSLALTLIAFAGGAEMRIEVLRQTFRSLSWAMLIHCVLGMLLTSLLFMAIRKLIPVAKDLEIGPLVGLALMWGALSISRSPAACLGILSQTRAKGPLATFSSAFVMSSNVVVLVIALLTITFVKPLILPGSSISQQSISDLWELLSGSVAVGTTLGLLLAIYMRLIGRELVLVLVVIGFGMSAILRYLMLDTMLVYLTAGFVVQNMSRQGNVFREAISGTGSVVYVVFFALAGAHLDLPQVRTLWPAALLLCVGRAGISWLNGRISGRFADDPPALRDWGWTSLVAQAGLTLGLLPIIGRQYPSLADGLSALVLATVALNEVAGPILFKLGLDRAGETSKVNITRESLNTQP